MEVLKKEVKKNKGGKEGLGYTSSLILTTVFIISGN